MKRDRSEWNIVKCPKCGKKGRLYFVRNYWIVKHGSKTTHYIPWRLIGDKIRIHLASYFGGDYYLAKYIVPLVNSIKHKCYVEVFGGMATILFNKKPSSIEVYNDKDNDLYNLFYIIREKPDEFLRESEKWLYGRNFYYEARKKYVSRDFKNDIERAVIFLYLLYSSFSSQIGAGFHTAPSKNYAQAYISSLERIKIIYKRLRTVIIENLDFRDVIRKYDSEKTLFYLDPPHLYYATEKDSYYAEQFTDRDYIELLDRLEKIRGKFILKQNENKYVLEWAKRNNFKIMKIKTLKRSVKKSKNQRPYMLVYVIYKIQ